MTKQEKLQAVFHLYETEHKHVPSRTRDVIEWAVERHLLSVPPPIDPFAMLAEQMSKALAEEYDTHNGRRFRVNRAIRVVRDGRQQTFWGIMGFASHQHMERAFAQRREHIVNECVQLHTDITVYNELNTGKVPEIQMVLDFTEDVAERQQS